MTIFEYVVVLVSVVISLGMARLLEGHALLIKHGRRVRWSATYLAWLLIIFLFHVDIWASLWQLHQTGAWSLVQVGCFLALAVSLFYASVLAAPELPADREIDLWRFHLANRRQYLWGLVGYGVVGISLNLTVLKQTFSVASLATTAPMLALLVAAMIWPAPWLQRAAPWAILALLLIYFVQFLPTLGI